MKYLYILFSSLVIYCPFANTWELEPEYLYLSPAEEEGFDDPSLTDSEYSSDILAFSRSSYQDWLWFRGQRQALINLGSIGSKNFMVDNHLKIHNSLTEKIFIKLHYLKEEDFDREFQAQIVELNYWISKSWALLLLGEGTYRKSEIDLGTGLLFRPNPDSEIRLWVIGPDFFRNERNKNSDRFSKAPMSYGIVGRHLEVANKEFLTYSFRWEPSTHWKFPDQSLIYKFKRKTGQVYFRKKVADEYFVFRWQGDIKTEEKEPISGTGIWSSGKKMERLRHQALFELDQANISPKYILENLRVGLFFTHREFDSFQGEATQTTMLPYFWGRRPGRNFGRVKDFWSLGLDSALFRETGSSEVTLRPHNRGLKEEFRLSAMYEIHFEHDAILKLAMTFDLDEFGGGETWEGGAGVFQMPF